MGWLDSVKDVAGPVLGFIGGELDRQHDQRQDAKQRQYQGEINAANAALQEQFAKMGIRWRMEDAIAAGVHPMAAMGFQGASAAPSYMAGDGFSARSNYRQMGQDLGRAALAGRTKEEKQLHNLQVERMMLENKALGLEIAKRGEPQNPPITQDITWQENTHPSVAYMRSPTGLVPIMPPNLAEALESDQTNQAQWAIRYKGGPNFAPVERPEKKFLPKNASGWMWNFKLQEWQPRTIRQLENAGRIAAEKKWRPRDRYRIQHQDLMGG